MGCDIHAYVDYKNNYGRHVHFCNPYISRNYELFTLLAGVRGPKESAVVSPRGVPDHLNDWIVEGYVLWIGDKNAPGEVTREVADQLLSGTYPSSTSREATYWNENSITNPYIHTPSWLYLHELQEVQLRMVHTRSIELSAIIAMMKALNDGNPERSRFIFWFDN